MSLTADVQEQIRRYVVGVVDGDDLSDWLDAHAQQIHDSGDVELRRIADLTHSLLEDVYQNLRTNDEARLLLAPHILGKVPRTDDNHPTVPMAPRS